jgi:iron complex transport system substrate-binding protein
MTTKLAGAVIVFGAAACLAGSAASARGQDRPAVEIVDSLGRTVAVPGRVERIISLEPETTRIIVALGAGENLVGIDFFLRNYDPLFPLVFPKGSSLPVVSNQGQDLHFEQAIRLCPDIVFASPSEYRAAETIERKLKVPVVALASMGRIETLLEEIGTLGLILGREERAAQLVSYMRSRLDEAAGQAKGRGPEDRPSVYLSFWGSLVRTPVSYDPVETAGGRNVAAGLASDYLGTAAVTIPLEKLFVWDPEVILIQGNYPPAERRVTVAGILRDPRLASLRAVRTGRVRYTFGFWYWWDPALVLIETFYLSRLFSRQDIPGPEFVRTGDEIFKNVYGADGVFGALCRVLECHEWTTR